MYVTDEYKKSDQLYQEIKDYITMSMVEGQLIIGFKDDATDEIKEKYKLFLKISKDLEPIR